jgi:hypothetical protein
VKRRLGWLLGALAWTAIVLVIALGGAGLVVGLDHPPGSAGRPDVTASGDAVVVPMLGAAESDLGDLADQVQALGTQARGALAALNGADPAVSDAAIAEGTRLVRDVVARTAAIRLALASVPYIGTPEAGLFVSDSVVERHDALVAALDATDGLDVSWLRLSVGSVAASRMSTALAEHDRLVGQAIDRGRLAKYADAIKLIDQAEAELTTARGIRNQLVNTVDVTVLDEWIARNADYDVALRKLYDAISKVGNKVTPATRAAVKAEAAARARLPPDTRGLVVIMSEIGRGGMNGAVIAIEEARAKLADAIDGETPTPTTEPDATPSPGPDVTPSPGSGSTATP